MPIGRPAKKPGLAEKVIRAYLLVRVFKVGTVSKGKCSQHYANFDCVHHEVKLPMEMGSLPALIGTSEMPFLGSMKQRFLQLYHS